ncbi:MAG: ribonuclease P protein component [Candidatus Marinimicrobia bacterium]|nr:ribonuclease P protein component [Candidatus Neomarinimicrobiota bacterium]
MVKFNSANKLNKNELYKAVTANGTKFNSKNFIIFLLKKNNSPTRLGITVSNKVGGAVVRNRVKRIVRQFIYDYFEKMPGNSDIVIIAKRSVSSKINCNYHIIARELKNILANKEL